MTIIEKIACYFETFVAPHLSGSAEDAIQLIAELYNLNVQDYERLRDRLL